MSQQQDQLIDSNRALLEACTEFGKIDRTEAAQGGVSILVKVEVKAGRVELSSNMRKYHELESKLMQKYPDVKFDFRYEQTNDLGSYREGHLC